MYSISISNYRLPKRHGGGTAKARGRSSTSCRITISIHERGKIEMDRDRLRKMGIDGDG